MKVFKEVQRFDQWWLRILFVVALLIAVNPLLFNYKQTIQSRSDLTGIVISVVIITAIFASFWFLFKLETRIDEEGVSFRYLPFHRTERLRKWEKIKSITVRKYQPIREYGGWGYRIGLRKRRALNVKGNMGIQIVYTNGRQLLLGTQRPREVEAVLKTYVRD